MIGRQRWQDLLFIHRPMPIDLLRRRVPADFSIDTFEGQAWVTLIPFAVRDSRPVGVPAALSMSFLEVNLRTYVRAPDGEPGIYFFSLEASSWLAVAGARLSYGLPYFPAAMHRQNGGDGTTVYRSRRIMPSRAARLETSWRIEGALDVAAAGTLEHFLIERYVLFLARGRRLYRARVHHQPYPLFRASVGGLRESLCEAAGLPGMPFPAPLVHHSPGVDVDIDWRQRL